MVGACSTAVRIADDIKGIKIAEFVGRSAIIFISVGQEYLKTIESIRGRLYKKMPTIGRSGRGPGFGYSLKIRC
jgi:hypothetical protein